MAVIAMIKCLMLDVDGVLVDGRPSDGQSWYVGLLKDLEISSDTLVDEFFQREWADIVVGKKDLLPTLTMTLERVAPHIRAADLISYWFKMDARVISQVLADCRIARHHGIPIFLTTNQEHLRAEYLTETMRLSDEVDGIIYSAKVGYRKPQPAFYDRAASIAGYDPSELLLVDDTLANVEGARLRGWQAVHWNETKSLSDILQRYTEHPNK